MGESGRQPRTTRLRGLRNARAGRRTVAIAVGVAAAALVLTADSVGLVSGPAAVLFATLLIACVPSSHDLSRRVFVNGVVALGFVPLLWWVRIPPVLSVGRAGALLALAAGVLVVAALWSSGSWRRLVPRAALRDAFPPAVAVVLFWFFAPFFEHAKGAAARSLLVTGFGGDNVGHYDMFAMIRRHFVFGPGWGTAPDGSAYAYVNYPQQFHTLAAAAAEGWSGVRVGTADQEIGLYGLGTALVLVAALMILAAGTVSLPIFRHRTEIAGVAVAAEVSFLILGFGASSLSYGFPGFLVAVIGALLGVLLALTPERSTVLQLLAVGATVVLVAHSWLLLVPFPAVAFLVVFLRLPRARLTLPRSSREFRAVTPAVVILLVVLAAGIVAVVLVLRATSSAGSPEDALGTTGGIAALPISLAITLGLALVTLGASVVRRRDPLGPGIGELWSPFATIGIVGVVGLIMGAGLAGVQVIHAHKLSYFQYKFFNALIMIFAVLLVCAIGALLARSTDAVARSRRIVVAIGAAVAVVAYSGIPAPSKPSLVELQSEGVHFRDGLTQAALADAGATRDYGLAADAMSSWPCERPFYFDGSIDGLQGGVANQWAMSFSGTWTERGSAVSSRLFATKSSLTPAASLEQLLAADPERCAVVSPTVKAALPEALIAQDGARILAWR